MKLQLIELRTKVEKAFGLTPENSPAFFELGVVLHELNSLIDNTKCDIEQVVCNEFKITKDQLHSKSRKRDIAESRQVIMWYETTVLKITEELSASRFGLSRTAANHSKYVINNLIETDKAFNKRLDSITNTLEAC